MKKPVAGISRELALLAAMEADLRYDYLDFMAQNLANERVLDTPRWGSVFHQQAPEPIQLRMAQHESTQPAAIPAGALRNMRRPMPIMWQTGSACS